MSESLKLLSPVRLGRWELPNRVVMAPLTRNRAGAGNVPGPMNALYYRQRATAGLIISEATQVSARGIGYPGTPGIHTEEQVAGWRLVTDAVHAGGGRIVLQLWFCGRIAHPDVLPNHELPVAPSAVAVGKGMAATLEGPKPYVMPRALGLEEIAGVIREYRDGARNAMEAGFDGVEIHGANGYLIDQFLRDSSNRRTDAYGGSVSNRARFAMEVVEAVTSVWGADRVGIRLSPTNTFNDMSDSDPHALFGHVVEKLSDYGLAYLHLMEPLEWDYRHPGVKLVPVADLRPLYKGNLIINGGFTRETGEEAIASGLADAVAFGTLFIANPDLPGRFRSGAVLNQPRPELFYGGSAEGYVDYPSLESA